MCGQGQFIHFQQKNKAAQGIGRLGSEHDLPVGTLQGNSMGYLVKSGSEQRRPIILRDGKA